MLRGHRYVSAILLALALFSTSVSSLIWLHQHRQGAE
jgi:hypothetical protein